MGSKRQLQAEVERVLKRIGEGLEVFDDIWDKLENASNQSQKDKWESDLKKEIKKLQRLREQVKTWATSNNDIRDKAPLLKGRRDVEIRMEKFKELEREMKTKAYSREGLQKSSRLSAEEQRVEDLKNYLQSKIEEIKHLEESAEAEVESLMGSKKKKNAEKASELQERIGIFTWHIDQLELVIRALENEVLTADEVEDDEMFKEDLEEFISMEGKDYPIDHIYDNFSLDEKMATQIAVAPVEVPAETKSAKKKKKSKKDGDGDKEADDSKKKKKDKKEKEVEVDPLLEQQRQRQAILAQQTAAQQAKKEEQKKQREQEENRRKQEMAAAANSTPAALPYQKGEQHKGEQLAQQKAEARPPQQPAIQQHAAPPDSAGAKGNDTPQSTPMDAAQLVPPLLGADMGAHNLLQRPGGSPASQQVQAQFSNVDLRQRLGLLDSSLLHCPHPLDSERPKTYYPKQPVSTPASFPSTPHARFETPELFKRLDTDTLFLIFFYQQGTYKQYLAARELNRQSWRFHKKYKTWFQRHQDPTQVTNEYEIGTCVYFDYENGWSQRIRQDFKFDYQYLQK